MATRYAQSKTHTAQITVAGRDIGQWDKAEGFDLEAEEIEYGEGPVAAGVRKRGNATVRRPYSDVDADLEGWLEDNIGKPAIVVRSRAGDDGFPIGRPRTYTGVLLSVMPPEGDRTASERSEFGLVFKLNVAAS